jgi:hypothetical protein
MACATYTARDADVIPTTIVIECKSTPPIPPPVKMPKWIKKSANDNEVGSSSAAVVTLRLGVLLRAQNFGQE